MSRTTGNETWTYLREKSCKRPWGKSVGNETQNEEASAQRLLLKQNYHQQQQQQQTQQQILLLLQNQQYAMMDYLKNLPEKTNNDLRTIDITVVKISWVRVKAIMHVNAYVNYIHYVPWKSTSQPV